MIPKTFKQAWKCWLDDQAPRYSAALTFFLMLSIVPLILVVVGVGALLLRSHGEANELQQRVLTVVRHSIGVPAATFVQGVIKDAPSKGANYAVTLISLFVSLVGASGLLHQLKDSVNNIWKAEPATGLKAIIWRRLFSLALALGLCAILVGWLVFDSVLVYVRRSFGPYTPFPLREVLSFVLSFAFWIPVLALVFKALSPKRAEWKYLWLGAVFSSLAYAAMKYGLSLYLSISSSGTAYGATANTVVILLWAYYSAQIFFFGVELTRACVERSD